MIPISRCIVSSLIGFAAAVSTLAETILFDASKPGTPDTQVTLSHATAACEDGLFIVTTKAGDFWPGITLKGNWSVPPGNILMVELENRGTITAHLHCHLDSPGADAGKRKRTFTASTILEAGKKKRWEIPMPRTVPPPLREKLFGMRGYPGGSRGDKDGNLPTEPFEPSELVEVRIFLSKPAKEHSLGIMRITVGPSATDAIITSYNTALDLPPEKFFPMIDRYGQFIHADWPAKVKSGDDLKKHREQEKKELAAAPDLPGRNQYGGWAGGPKLEATGHFHAAKYNGLWWLVDPEGRLFWSHGVTCVNHWGGITPISDREHLFTELPFESFKAQSSWAVHGYYVNKTPCKTYNFTASNLRLKYGDDWQRRFAETVHHRLRTWGLNTIANWSDSTICKLRKTPYTANLNTSGPVIAGSKGYWAQFRDPFHPDFRKNLAGQMAGQREAATDPWCIGFFIDNELGWGNDTSLSAAALASPPTQPAKIAMLGMLRAKYHDIEKLNSAWKTFHADWNALLLSTGEPDTKNETIAADLRDGTTLIAEKYFAVIRDELKKAAPDKLYLGCRFAWVNDLAILAAGKYCDVISFNWYKYDIAAFNLPSGVDKAVIIGEFHFGALDRGMFHSGLAPVSNQRERAAAYEKYVRSGLKHPNIVGTHWFQYGDQATTGRSGDGENYQIGLVDICDTPYAETIDALRSTATTLYETRLSAL